MFGMTSSFWIVFNMMIMLAQSNKQNGVESNFPTLNELATYLNIDHFNNIEQLSTMISKMNVRFTVDVYKSISDAYYLNISLSEHCVFFTPTYYLHIEDSQLAKMFNQNTNTQSNITTFIAYLDIPLENTVRLDLNLKRRTLSVNDKLWIHTEKTGGSFSPTVSGLGYREQGHTPAPKEGCHLDNCRLVSLFRDPKQRSASWFYFSKFSKVCLKGSQGNIDEVKACFKLHVDTLYNKPIENLSNRSKSKFDKIDLWGCQSKMMLGYRCETPKKELPVKYQSGKSGEHLMSRGAIEVLWRDYDFMGITDDFDASVVLIHQILGGQLDINSALSKINTRNQVGNYKYAMQDGASEEIEEPVLRAASFHFKLPQVPRMKYKECYDFSTCDNQPDEILFIEVKKLFIRHILIHHKTPIRIINTFEYANKPDSKLIVPKESRDVVEGKEYMNSLTRIIDNHFNMSNQECIHL